MQKRLAFYMITLALILAAALVAGLFFFNQLCVIANINCMISNSFNIACHIKIRSNIF